MAASSSAIRAPMAAAWLAAIVDSSEDAIVSKTLDGIVTSWNPAAERLFGYRAEEVIGGPIAIIAAPGRANEMPAILERIRRGEKIEHYETLRRRKDGSLVEISLTISPIRDDAGEIVGASKIARDITDRRRAEQALAESERRFRSLANTVPDIVWTADPDGTVTFANERWLDFCGAAAQRPANQWPELATHPDDQARSLERWRQALRDGTTFEVEVRHRRYDGAYRWFLTRALPVRDADGRIVAWFGSTTDIHERKQVEERQSRLTAELSHRVKNILTVVKVLAERSAANATSVTACMDALRGRLQALSAAHDALTAGSWKQASLPQLVRTVLEPHLGERVRLAVEDLRLDAELALTLALQLNELATNAVKHGALSSSSGRVSLTARIERSGEREELRLLWQEDGGPPVQPPAGAGFGMTMLSQAIQYQHEGTVDLDWRRAGLICRVTVPLSSGTAASLP